MEGRKKHLPCIPEVHVHTIMPTADDSSPVASDMGSQQVPSANEVTVHCHSSLAISVPLQSALSDSYLNLLIDHVLGIWDLRSSGWDCVSTGIPARLELESKGEDGHNYGGVR